MPHGLWGIARMPLEAWLKNIPRPHAAQFSYRLHADKVDRNFLETDPQIKRDAMESTS